MALVLRAFQTADDASEAFRQAFAAYYRGWSVVPCVAATKHTDSPLMRETTGSTAWKPFQTRVATLRELEAWQGAEAFAVVTGALSGVVVLDVDNKNNVNGMESLRGLHLPETVAARTPSGGFHYYFRHPGGHVKTDVGMLPCVDMRGDGGYAVMPGAAGREWVPGLSPEDVPLAPMPAWLAEKVVGPTRKRAVTTPLDLPTPRTSYANPAQAFAGSPSALRDVKGDALTAWFRDEAAVLRMAATLGIEVDGAAAFHDVMPGLSPDANPSASLYRNASGVWVYRSWRLPAQQFFYLGDVLASQAYGSIKKLCRTDEQGRMRVTPEAAVWSIRLLVEAGLLKPAAVPHRPLANTAPARAAKLYEGFLLLLGCKWLHTHGDASPFSWRFAAAWCGLTERNAGDAMHWLLKHGYLTRTGKHKLTSIFKPCEVLHEK